MRRLNNKGFTLIELLAVIVILAVVMGIAANSVISTMNNSRMGTIHDSTLVISKAMDEKLIDAQVTGTAANVKVGTQTMDFSSSGMYYLTEAALKSFKLSTSDYETSTNTTKVTAALPTASPATASFVTFEATNGSFVVCLVAKSGGKVWVDALKSSGTTLAKASTGLSFDIKFGSNVMYNCSNGSKSK